MITLLKLGGSLITDKNQQSTLRPEILNRIAREIRLALDEIPEIKLIIGHGSGSFGHFEAKKYNTMAGVKTHDEWIGFSQVAIAAGELNYHVSSALHRANVPVLRIQPSASAVAEDGIIVDMNISSIQSALKNNLIPLVYGDVAFDRVRGGTIVSTETIFTYLVSQFNVSRIILLGEVDGVYDAQGEVIEIITPENLNEYRSVLGGSDGVDVTGGMLTKVQDMLQIATNPPHPVIQIINGTKTGIVQNSLKNKSVLCTTIRA